MNNESIVNGLDIEKQRKKKVNFSRTSVNGCSVRSLKVGVVGLGYWGPNLVRNFSANLRSEVTSICDLDVNRLQKVGIQYPTVKQTTNYSDLLDITDAVAISTPVESHFELAKMALEAGKHCLVENTIALDIEQGEELVDLAKTKKLVLAVDHTFLFTSAVQKIKQIIDSGELGDLWYFDSVRINLGRFQRNINVVWDLAPHDLSIMHYLLGEEASNLVCLGTSHTPLGLVDVAYINLELGSGFIANFHLNWLSPIKIRSIIIGGSKKMLIYDDMNPMDKIKVFDKGIDLKHIVKKKEYEALVQYRISDVYAPAINNKEALSLEVDNFISAILDGAKLIADGESGVRIVKILVATNKSLARFGARVQI